MDAGKTLGFDCIACPARADLSAVVSSAWHAAKTLTPSSRADAAVEFRACRLIRRSLRQAGGRRRGGVPRVPINPPSEDKNRRRED